MQRPETFREDLEALLALAAANDFCLTRKQVEDSFKEYRFSPEQMETVYQYLAKNCTIVDDDVETTPKSRKRDEAKTVQAEDTPEDETVHYKMYMADLAALPPFSKKREEQQLARYLDGDDEVVRELIEGRLRFAAKTAALYRGKGLPLMDLIQEANMAVVLAVSEYTGGSFEERILQEIKTAIEAALEEAGMAADGGANLASQVNNLMIVTARLAEELGREATLEELSERMHMPQESVRELVKMAMDAMTLQDDEPISPELS